MSSCTGNYYNALMQKMKMSYRESYRHSDLFFEALEEVIIQFQNEHPGFNFTPDSNVRSIVEHTLRYLDRTGYLKKPNVEEEVIIEPPTNYLEI